MVILEYCEFVNLANLEIPLHIVFMWGFILMSIKKINYTMDEIYIYGNIFD